MSLFKQFSTTGGEKTGTGTDLWMTRETAPRGKDGQFYLNIKNTLGLESTNQRAFLKNFALSNPAEYTTQRAKIYMDVVSTMVERNYETVWTLLSDGTYKDNSGNPQSMEIDGKVYAPRVPDPEIAKLANGFSEAILKAFDEIISKILPDNYRDMAEEKIKGTTQASGKGDIMG